MILPMRGDRPVLQERTSSGRAGANLPERRLDSGFRGTRAVIGQQIRARHPGQNQCVTF